MSWVGLKAKVLLLPLTLGQLPDTAFACSTPYTLILARPHGEQGFYRRFPDGQILKVQITEAALDPDGRILAFRLLVLEGSTAAQRDEYLIVIGPHTEIFACEEIINPYNVRDDGIAEGYVELPWTPAPNGYFLPFQSSQANETMWNEMQKSDPSAIIWKPVKFERPEWKR